MLRFNFFFNLYGQLLQQHLLKRLSYTELLLHLPQKKSKAHICVRLYLSLSSVLLMCVAVCLSESHCLDSCNSLVSPSNWQEWYPSFLFFAKVILAILGFALQVENKVAQVYQRLCLCFDKNDIKPTDQFREIRYLYYFKFSYPWAQYIFPFI